MEVRVVVVRAATGRLPSMLMLIGFFFVKLILESEPAFAHTNPLDWAAAHQNVSQRVCETDA